ncbi:MFS transporter [Streptomyces mobaraensis NBRC 13819 = DSM 40847]|uniref:Transmembrane efflux protein n=1 Tax=Streptomyces mobaraensis (strain ATCC 29032 / DSM 40847 / JCM 4168 / NBRC 13819 / NCIMB 11159 / IPCR 16-22) TaxID=1223523 RepID=M3CCM9_STRM1|nr:MFS transporter [Streptomyces mobaraensis]EMF01751.1 transmembrane efflux protein [Streptomyces mobaraensis NBRC 13819 = DSM 40847]QTT77017.1 MFS transporter [Streptomyces mobaraensis NBRC 13819 = DSM 40847]
MYLADSRTSPASPASAVPADRPGRPGRRYAAVPGTVLVLGTVSLITDVSSEMVTAVLPLYLVAGLGLSPLGFGLLDGVYNGVSALVRLLGGGLADRGAGPKAVAAAGYGLSALCKPLLLAVHTVPLIGAVLAADRTGKGLRTAPRDAMISLACQPAERGRAFGAHRAMDTAGALLGPVAAFLILRVAAGGYDAVFTVSGCVAALGVLVLLLFVPGRSGTPERASDHAARRAPRAPVRALLQRSAVRRLALCAALLGLTTVSDSFLYLTLQRRLDLSESWFPLLPLGTAASFLLLAVPVGILADRFGRRLCFLCGHLALLGAYVLLVTPLGDSSALAGVVLLLHGSFYAATDGVLAAATADAVPEAVRGSGLAVVQTGQAGARFVCSIAFGAAWTAWGDRTALGLAAVGLAVSALASAGLLRPGAPGDADGARGTVR